MLPARRPGLDWHQLTCRCRRCSHAGEKLPTPPSLTPPTLPLHLASKDGCTLTPVAGGVDQAPCTTTGPGSRKAGAAAVHAGKESTPLRTTALHACRPRATCTPPCSCCTGTRQRARRGLGKKDCYAALYITSVATCSPQPSCSARSNLELRCATLNTPHTILSSHQPVQLCRWHLSRAPNYTSSSAQCSHPGKKLVGGSHRSTPIHQSTSITGQLFP